MAFLVGFLIVILILVSILLILIVLIQDDGAEGAGMLLGSSASQQYGARKGNIITRATGILATLFVSISLLLVFLFRDNDENLQAIERNSDTDRDQLVQWWNEEIEDNPNEINDNTDNNTDENIDENTEILDDAVQLPSKENVESNKENTAETDSN